MVTGEQQQTLMSPIGQQQMPDEQRLYHEHCPRHGGGPSRSPDSNEDIVGSLVGRIGEMVVKETSGLSFYFTFEIS